MIFRGNCDEKDWYSIRTKTDILMALSVEEGTYLFVPEFWVNGTICIIGDPGPCTSYTKLGKNIVTVKGKKYPVFGTGSYNDVFLSDVYFPMYGDGVQKLRDILLRTHPTDQRPNITDTGILDDRGYLIEAMINLGENNEEGKDSNSVREQNTVS